MAATIKIKNSSTASAVPTSSDLVQGELAVNVTDKRIFTENASGTVVELGTNPSTLTVAAGATIQGLTVGRGAGSVSTNTAVGASALAANTSGTLNTGVGSQANKATTTGDANTAVGADALLVNTTGSNNSAFGYASLKANTTGAANTAYGQQTLFSNTTASSNTAVGYQAGYSVTTANNNALLGYQTGYSLTSGNFNTIIGQQAAYYVTTGSKNTVIGTFNGNQGGLDIRTASNYIVLSDGDGNPRVYFDGSSGGRPWFTYTASSRAVFQNTAASVPYGIYTYYSGASPNNSSSDFLLCDDSTITRAKIYSNGGLANYQANNANLSDRREKTNFAPAKSYLDVICAIPVQTFNYIDQNLEEDGGLTLGVVAQDVQAVAPELVMESNWAKEGDEPKMRLSIYQTDLQYALMKALQELKAEFDAYKEAHP